MSRDFNFLSQCPAVAGLLQACLDALQHLPAGEREELAAAMREFEHFSAPTLWGVSDVDADMALGITPLERAEVINRFCSNYERKDADWQAIDSIAHDVLQERIPHIAVEYDPYYTGGAHEGDSQIALIPLAVIEAVKPETSEDDAVELAFRKITHMDSMHIVRYAVGSTYNQAGELIGPPSGDVLSNPEIEGSFADDAGMGIRHPSHVIQRGAQGL